VISASCSPEGYYAANEKLALARSESVCEYISEYVPEQWKECLKVSCLPENWDQLRLLVKNDTVLGEASVQKIMAMTADLAEPDAVEKRLSSMPQYRYLREKIYPKLRSVRFEFFLHRPEMDKDTVHTSEVDTLYMSGVKALKDLDYKKAVSLLRTYGDYNSALAFVSAEYNHSALDVLQTLDGNDPKVCYLMAMVLSRLEQHETAEAYFRKALNLGPYLRHRANLDPEMSKFIPLVENEY